MREAFRDRREYAAMDGGVPQLQEQIAATVGCVRDVLSRTLPESLSHITTAATPHRIFHRALLCAVDGERGAHFDDVAADARHDFGGAAGVEDVGDPARQRADLGLCEAARRDGRGAKA